MESSTVDKQVRDLTESLSKKCHGKGAVVAIGACLNVLVAASYYIPDMDIKRKVAELLRKMATDIEQQPRRH